MRPGPRPPLRLARSRDPATAAETVEFLPPGSASAQGLRVRGFDHRALRLASARGPDCDIPFGKSAVITLD